MFDTTPPGTEPDPPAETEDRNILLDIATGRPNADAATVQNVLSAFTPLLSQPQQDKRSP